jgi:hypothetical protein
VGSAGQRLKRERESCGAVWWAERRRGLGRLYRKGKEMTAQALVCSLPNKINMFGLGFEKEFEFDSLSNSNFTQLNSK